MKRTFISLGVAFLVAALVYISIFFFDPGMYVEKAFNILVAAFVGSAVVTSLVLRRKRKWVSNALESDRKLFQPASPPPPTHGNRIPEPPGSLARRFGCSRQRP